MFRDSFASYCGAVFRVVSARREVQFLRSLLGKRCKCKFAVGFTNSRRVRFLFSAHAHDSVHCTGCFAFEKTPSSEVVWQRFSEESCRGGGFFGPTGERGCACAPFWEEVVLSKLKLLVRFSRACVDGSPLPGDANSLVV